MEELDNFLVDIVVDPASVVHIDFDWEHEMHLELDHLLLMKKKECFRNDEMPYFFTSHKKTMELHATIPAAFGVDA